MSDHIADSAKVFNRVESQQDSAYAQVVSSALNKLPTANCTAYPPRNPARSVAASTLGNGV